MLLLLRFGLLLAKVLQFIVDLLGRLDAIWRWWLRRGVARAGRCGCVVRLGWIDWIVRGRHGAGCVGGWGLMANGPYNRIWNGLFGGIAGFVEALSVWIGWSGAALARSQDEFGWGGSGAVDEKHVAAGAVEQRAKDVCGGRRAVVAEDALVGYAAGDFDSGEAGDFMKNLVEAGVAGRYGDHVVGVGDLCALGRALGWGEGHDCRGRGCGK